MLTTPQPTPSVTEDAPGDEHTVGHAQTDPNAATPHPRRRQSGPTATPRPTNTPKPTATPTAKPAALSGKIAFTVWNPHLGTGKYELYVSNIDGSGRNMLGTGFRQPQFRQDGNLLAVERRRRAQL